MLSAILFDLDGTLANTDEIHFKVWQEILAGYGIQCDRNFFQAHISGNTNEQIITELLPQLSPPQSLQLAIDKEAQYRAKATTLQPTPGLDRLLQLIDVVPLKTAVVTNAPKANAVHMLELLNLTKIFPLVILAEDAPPGKPNPAPYLLGLEKVAVAAPEAIAFEDSPTGIQAAVAAGIYTIAIASTHDSESLKEFGASMVIPDFNSPQLWQLINKQL
jgi:HAD superfamily hydrolase (TIGR01509 family)